MTSYVDAKNNLFPEAGARLRHRALGVEGAYVTEVYANKSKRHLKVVDDAGRVYVLPANDWVLVEGKARWRVGDEAWVKTGWVDEQGKYHPARYMLKAHSPFSIKIIAHRVEYLRAISPEDVEREGIDVVNNLPLCPDILTIQQLMEITAWSLFKDRWDSIYGKMPRSVRWQDNPLVEVLTFEVVKADRGKDENGEGDE